MTHDPRWREQALCAQTDSALFFPASGEIPHAAKRVCNACPVRADCLDDALARRDSTYGVLGGTTPTERRRMLRRLHARAREAAACAAPRRPVRHG